MRKIRGRPLKILLAVLCCLIPGGCWDVEEINRRSTADTIFLDLTGDGLVRLGGAAHIPGTLLPPYNGTEQQLSKRHFMIYGEGLGAIDAWKEMQTSTNRGLYLGHARALIISEAYARKAGLSELLDFIDRSGVIPGTVIVLITRTDPRDLLEMKIKNNAIPGNYIAEYFESPEKRTLAIPVELWQVEAALSNGIPDVCLPCIEPSQGQYRIAGAAVFAGNAWAGRLSVEETELLALLLGSSDGYLTVPLGGGDLVAFARVNSRADIEVARRNGALRFEVGLKVEGVLRETRPKKPRIALAEEEYYTARVEGFLRDRVLELLRRLQDLGSDPVGFGHKVRIKYPRYWQESDWHRVFPKARFRVRVGFTMRNTGKFR